MKRKKKHLFTNLVKCGLCGSNYRFIKDRSISKYICNNYSLNGKEACERNAIKEKHILMPIKTYCDIHNISYEESHDFFSSLIEVIYVKRDETTIIYKDGHKNIISPNLYKV